MIAVAVKIPYVRTPGVKLPKRQWLAQISTLAGMRVETLTGEHETEGLALAAAEREIRNRMVTWQPPGGLERPPFIKRPPRKRSGR